MDFLAVRIEHTRYRCGDAVSRFCRDSGTARMRRNGIKILTRFIPIPLLASLPGIPHN